MPSTLHSHLRLVSPAVEQALEPVPGAKVPDEMLLAGLEARDPGSSAAFYDRARPIIDRTLSRLLGTHDPEYEDLAQSALYQLVDTIAGFRHECPLDSWLSLVTARVAYRAIRRRRVERQFFSEIPHEELTTSLFSVPVAFAQRQALERIRTHLARMDEKRAWTFMLHDVYGYELKQISEIMQTSVSAAQSRLVRGRRELHDRVRNDPTLGEVIESMSEDTP